MFDPDTELVLHFFAHLPVLAFAIVLALSGFLFFLTFRNCWSRFKNSFLADLKSVEASGGLLTSHETIFMEAD